MRLAVISDIHSNLEAFQAVLEDIAKHAIDEVISLGDNIGYGPEPEAIIVTLKRHSISSVLGNHELALLDETYLETFNPYARKALIINKKKLSDPAKHYISTWPTCLVRHGCRLVHGTPPDSVASYFFNEPDKKLIQIMGRLKERLTFVGHTHQLGIYELDQGKLTHHRFLEFSVSLAKSRRYIINTGSVGQPRDGYNQAKYVIWDSACNTVAPRLVPYDFHSTAKKIKAAGIPTRYADLLEKAVI